MGLYGLALDPLAMGWMFPRTLGSLPFSAYLLSPWLLLKPLSDWRLGVAAGLVPVVVALGLSRAVLWKRAFIRPQNRLLKLLRRLDAWFHQLNQNRVTRGIVLVRDQAPLPYDRPIAWRETTRRTLGTARYLLRLLLVLEIPLLLTLIVPAAIGGIWMFNTPRFPPAEFCRVLLWWFAVFAVTSHATGLIAGERSRQTLDVLLSVPMSASEIVAQKFAGVTRLIGVLWVPLLTVDGFRIWWSTHFLEFGDRPQPLLCSMRCSWRLACWFICR
jgi:hypothetical protein